MNVLDEVKELFGMILDHTDSIQQVKLQVRMKNGANIKYGFDRKKWEKQIEKEKNPTSISSIFNAIIDLIGTTTSISILVLLIVFASRQDPANFLVVNTVYGSVLVLYFLFSSIYHFMDESYAPRQFFYMFRIVLQYILVGVTFIVVTFNFIGGVLGTTLYSAMVIAGIIGLFLSGRNTSLSRSTATGFLIAMIWLWIPGIHRVITSLGLLDGVLLIITSILYTMWGIISNRRKQDGNEFIAGNLYLLLSSFPAFVVYLHILGVLPA